MSDKQIDPLSGTETTGHEWDGITELNNPLPRWWLWTFYATIVFSIGYVVWYPAIPLINDATTGLSGQTNRTQLIADLADAAAAQQEQLDQLAELNLEKIRSDGDLARFARAGGASLYKVHCSQCHGSGATGTRGYPNLNDDDWLWGGSLTAIYTSIKHGIRSPEDDDTRDSEMPAFGTDDLLTSQEISALSEFVLTLGSGTAETDTEVATLYADNCAGCHGETGTGDRDLGAPNIADAVALYGNSREEIASQIASPKHGIMPPWGGRLSDVQIKQLALFVHGLGGGEAAAEAEAE